MKTTLFQIALAVVLCAPLYADAAPSVRAAITPSTAKLGDVLKLTLDVTYPNGFSIDAPDLQKDLGTFETRTSTALPAEVQGGQTTAHFVAALQNFTTGQQLLPPIAVTYRDIQGQPHRIQTPPLTVTIGEVPAGPNDKGDIRGIKGVVGPVAASPWWWVLLAVFLAAAGVFLWTKRRRQITGPPPPVPADQAALEALQRLRATGWLESGKMKEFYSGLSDIVRTYLEHGFKIPALERTTAELMRDVRRRADLPSETLVDLQTLLESGDLVKFAKFRPEASEAMNDHALALRIVDKTKALLPAKPYGAEAAAPQAPKKKAGVKRP